MRGPTANIYGSGAIGGVASFRTKNIDDILRPGERWGVDMTGSYGSNNARGLGSIFGGVRADPNVDIFGGAVYRTQGNYKDGAGTEIGNTGNEIAAGLMKVTVRPADGHEVKFGTMFQDYKYAIGQPNGARRPPRLRWQRSRAPRSMRPMPRTTSGPELKDSKPDDNWFDWSATVDGNRVENDQVKTYNNRITTGGGVCSLGSPGKNISGCVGDKGGHLLDTVGIDVEQHHAVQCRRLPQRRDVRLRCVQGRRQHDRQHAGNSNITTPGGHHMISGGFIQLKQNYSTWLEVVSAIRYDRYDLELIEGIDRRRPLLAEDHRRRHSGGRLHALCQLCRRLPRAVDHGNTDRGRSCHRRRSAAVRVSRMAPPDCSASCQIRRFVPKSARTRKPASISKYDGIFAADDSFRGKFNVFRNDVEGYIDLVGRHRPGRPTAFGPFSNSISTRTSPMPGSRASKPRRCTMPASGMSASPVTLMRGKNVQTNIGLATITPRKVTTTAGIRLLDRSLILAMQWSNFAANNDIPVGYQPSTAYDLVNLYLTWNATKDIVFSASIDNLLNQYYRPYAIPGSSADNTTQNDVLWASPVPAKSTRPA